jgi:vancomycin resistance protein VanJ
LIPALLVLYAVMIAGWLAARAIWGDGPVLLAVINSFPTLPFWPVPVALLLAALDRRPVSVVAALIPALIWVVVFGWRFLPRGGTVEAGTAEIRVMAFNVLYVNQDLDAMAAAITAAAPDLIALPELTPRQNAGLAERIGDRYPYRTLQQLPNAGFGTGIYSRWPLRDLGSLQTGLGLRSALADVETPAGTVRFLAVHPRATLARPDTITRMLAGMRTSFRGREAQVAAICRYLEYWDMPVIAAGDFNLSEFSDAYRCIAGRLADTYREVGRGYGPTWPGAAGEWPWPLSWFSQTRIDYVFHSRHWRAVAAEVIGAPTGSDHKIVVAALAPR